MSMLTDNDLDLFARVPAGSRLFLENVPWSDYEEILSQIHDESRVRLSYDRGRLEIMTLSPRHESLKGLFAHLVAVLTQEQNLDFISFGSATYKLAEAEKGTEPDDCFYITNFAKVAGKDEIDLDVDPPPDLVVEIDITHPSLDKLPIYAGLGVREVWRHDGTDVTFYVLGAMDYEAASHSRLFGFLTSQAIGDFVRMGKAQGSNAMIKVFRFWVREHRTIDQ